MTYFIKIVTGFREDQFVSVPLQEAHKAYYLFLNPDTRTIFSNGVAILGRDIQRIVPDWNATMDWNDMHKIDSYDLAEIKANGVHDKMKSLMAKAKDISLLMAEQPDLATYRLQDAIPRLPDFKSNDEVEALVSGIIFPDEKKDESNP